ncbi:MAG: hypothetical protein AAFO06_04710 [Cyanobacteria bacterium J06597_16]
MTKLTIDIPDSLIRQVQSAGQSIESILLEALTRYVNNRLPEEIANTSRTLELCGQYSVSEPEPDAAAIAIEDFSGRTNYAEQIDDVLYRGS